MEALARELGAHSTRTSGPKNFAKPTVWKVNFGVVWRMPILPGTKPLHSFDELRSNHASSSVGVMIRVESCRFIPRVG